MSEVGCQRFQNGNTPHAVLMIGSFRGVMKLTDRGATQLNSVRERRRRLLVSETA